MDGRIIKSDLDCADCLCAVCTRNPNTSMVNSLMQSYERVCSPCDNCGIGQELIETEDDCSRFLGDDLFYDERYCQEYGAKIGR